VLGIAGFGIGKLLGVRSVYEYVNA
jgi:hypothetical protein